MAQPDAQQQSQAQAVIVRGNPNTNEHQFSPNFDDIVIRHNFIRKVFAIVLMQLVVTTSVVAPFVLLRSCRDWIRQNLWIYHLSYTLFVILYLVLVCPCCCNIGRIWPWNMIILSVFTISFSFMLSVLASLYTATSVLYALAATIFIVFVLVLFASQTKYDFTSKISLISIFSLIFIVFSFAIIIYYIVVGPSKILHMVYCAVGAFLFSIYLVYDIQLVIGGKNRAFELSPEEYVTAAVFLYLDILNLFLSLLGLLGEGDSN